MVRGVLKLGQEEAAELAHCSCHPQNVSVSTERSHWAALSGRGELPRDIYFEALIATLSQCATCGWCTGQCSVHLFAVSNACIPHLFDSVLSWCTRWSEARLAGRCSWESAGEQRTRLSQAQSTCSSLCYHSGVSIYLNSCPLAIKEAADRKDCRYPRTSAKWE